MTTRSALSGRNSLEELLDEMLEESGGPPTRAEMREADRQLGVRGRGVETHRDGGHARGVAPYKKIAISLPLHAAEHVRRAVRSGQAKSVSAYIADAIEQKAKKETWRELFGEVFAATGGWPTAAEREATRRELGLPPLKKRGKKR
jgi:Arc/MetJ-type ribon-helix-helix transcriptional regulator